MPTLPAPAEGPEEWRIRLRDTLTGELVETGGPDTPATLYVCGITPYDATHLGHATTYLAFDVLQRAWRDAGRTVSYVQNVTDIDDPLLERAEATGVDWRDLAREQTDLFRSDMEHLRVLAPEHYIGAVESIDLVADGAARMLRAEQAYRVPTENVAPDAAQRELGDVYADFATDRHFTRNPVLADGTLHGTGLEEVFAENGGDPERPGKRGPLDALLWRRSRAGEPEWDGGELGSGRPGWHLECACIALRYLGRTVEVQGGGRDLVFPHHEMSESHLRALTGLEAPVGVHAHVGMVAYEGTKMSKSLGNLVLVSKLVADGVEPAAIRLAVLSQHYRSDWEYTDALLERAQERLALWRRAVAQPFGASGRSLLAGVRAALAEDLDTPLAISLLDIWAEDTLEINACSSRPHSGGYNDLEGPALARDLVDALLGIEL